MESQKYRVLWGLPVLSSDAISSVAYATEEILLVFIPLLGMASYGPMMGVAGVIIALLFMLILCYRQVIDAYPQAAAPTAWRVRTWGASLRSSPHQA